MAKRSSPSELNSRTIRVNIDDWRWINSLSLSLGVTVAEVFHKIVTGQDFKVEPQNQIPTPVFFIPRSIADTVTSFKPKSIVGNGVAHIKLKSIKGVDHGT